MRNLATGSLRKLMLASALGLFACGIAASDVSAQSRGSTQRMVDESQVIDDWMQRIQPNWAQYSQSLQRELNRLTPQDLARTNGGRAEVISAIQDRYNLSNERAADRLTAWQMRQR